MKKIYVLFAFILFSVHSSFAQTWDVLDKVMNPWNADGGTAVNRAWEVNQGSSASGVATQQAGYVNFTKTNTGTSARWAWVRPATAFADLTPGAAYSIEVKARLNPVGIADAGSYYESNQISLRSKGDGICTPIYLKYGDGVTGGFVGVTSGGTDNVYKLNTSEWQVYRLVFHTDHSTYDVYIDGVGEAIFENVATISKSDNNGVYFGAESQHRCNMDVEYVKMGTGDFYSQYKIVSVHLSSNSHLENTEKTITVTIGTALIDDGEKLLISLVNSADNVVVDAVETFVSQDRAEADFTIPATVPKGKYFVKVAAPNGKIGDIDIRPKTAEYFVCLANKLPDWTLGGFVRPENKNPVIVPDAASVFFCPMNQAYVKWEESDTFNPAAVVKDDKICVLYRAEDNSATGIGKRVSRVALAETADGVTMTKRPTPVFYPDNDSFSQTYEWPGGCEDPRVTVTEDGTYVMFYTGWDRTTARLCVATSRDLLTWTRFGPIFAQAYAGKYLNTWTKSSSIVTELKGDKQVIARMNVKYNGKDWLYFMYWGENRTCAAVSDDLINWTPLEDGSGNLLALAHTRKDYFDSSLVECGPPAVITDKGIVLLYNGRNATNADADPRFNTGTYSAGQMLFDLNDPCKLLERTNVPFFRPMEDFEKSGQYANGTVFIEGLVYYKQKWYLYYGCADSKVGVAVYDPNNPADGDPIPDYPQGKGIAYYPPHGLGKKIAHIHSASGQTKDSESAFNLLYSYLSPRKWCEDKNANPWVIFELADYYNIEKTVFRDVAPYESGNGNVPEYWIYTSVTDPADGNWKEVVHKTQQQGIDVKEDVFDIPEEARYIKFVASRGTRTDNGNAENAIRIYGFDIYGSFSRAVDRGDVVSVGKTVLDFYDASEYYCQPLHLLDGDVTNQANRWYFNQASETDSLKYVIIDLENEYEIEKFALYDAGNFEAQSYNIDGYIVYVSTSAPDLNLISKTEDKNTVWTKVVDTKGCRSDNIKTNIIAPVAARYVKLEIPRSRTYGAVRLYQFEVYKKGENSGIVQANANNITIIPSVLRSGENLTLRGCVSGKLRIFNLQGVLVMDKNISEKETVIPLQIPAGAYVAEVKSNASEKAIKLTIKQY
ncbi:MAG: discoidin domain-containing protein [Prevotella sp.]|jgi:predicted GH43/DUF377 family glycosyl hydrolase|nr:discoidin domain-containing protein [Prevotella sp.]